MPDEIPTITYGPNIVTTAKHLTTLRSEKGTDLGVAYSALPSREPFSDLLYAVPLDGRQASPALKFPRYQESL